MESLEELIGSMNDVQIELYFILIGEQEASLEEGQELSFEDQVSTAESVLAQNI